MVCVVSAGGVCDGLCCVCRRCVMVCVVSAGGVCDGLCCVCRRCV